MDNNGLELRRSIRQCRACGLGSLSSGPIPPTFPTFPREPRVLVLGEAADRGDARALAPGRGPGGVLVRGLLSEAGIDPETIAWANVVSCWPLGAGRVAGVPTEIEVVACRGNLVDALVEFRPQYVLAMGMLAAKSLGFEGEMATIRGTWRGAVGPSQSLWVMATYSSAYLLKNPAAVARVVEDMEAFMFYSMGHFTPQEPIVEEEKRKPVKVNWN